MKEIKRIVCLACEDSNISDVDECDDDEERECTFTVSTANGSVEIDKDGYVDWSGDININEGQYIKDILSQIDLNEGIHGTCYRCEDEASIRVEFEDGTSTEDEESAFIQAFIN